MKVKELRIILTVENLDEIIRFYRDVAGMETSKEWRNEPGSGIILDAGRASLELIDAKHAATIDTIEVGKRIAGPVRLALRVNEDIDTSTEKFVNGGAKSLHYSRSCAPSIFMVMRPGGLRKAILPLAYYHFSTLPNIPHRFYMF